jgi:putative acetyltransferase
MAGQSRTGPLSTKGGKGIVTVRCLLPEDREAVAHLLTRCYGTPREAQLLELLRDAGDMRLELVWTQGTRIEGHIGFLRHESPAGWWALVLLAVHPRHRRRGRAGELLRQGLDLARQNRARAVTVVGDPAWFRRFGFSRKAAAQLTTPFDPARTLLYPIRPGMAGVSADLTYPAELLPD